ncbi:MAG: iron ABC transporter permease [Deltaproteobacteria bacterium]|nr:iron ABC transporter permease [Deltaproteobacteria bacterium]
MKAQLGAVAENLRWYCAPVLPSLRQNLFVFLLIAFAVWLVIVPLLQLVAASFQAGTIVKPEGWTLNHYVEAYSAKVTYEAVVNTLAYAITGTFLSLTIAVLFAWFTERTDLPGRNVIWTLILLPMAMPGMLFAMGWTFLLEPRIGLVNVYLRAFLSLFGLNLTEGPFNIHTLWGLIFLDGIRGVTTIFLIIAGAFRRMDPALEESALASGASGHLVMRRITLPLLTPAILAAGMYSLMVSMDSFELPLIVGLPGRIFVFTTLIYFSAQGLYPPNYGLASAFGTTFLIFGLLLVGLNRLAIRNPERYAIVTGKGYRPRLVRLGKWRFLALGTVSLYVFLTVVAPFAVLLWVSLLPIYQIPSYRAWQMASLKNYMAVLSEDLVLGAVINTLVVGVATATVVLLLAFAISWAVVRLQIRGRAILDGIAFLPQVVPSIILALAMIILYARPPLNVLPIYGTLWIVVLGLTTNYLAFGTRAMNGAVIQVSKELEEAARASGAGRTRMLFRITLPLILPAFVSAWIWVLAHAMRAFSIPLILASSDTELISVRLWIMWERGAATSVAALGIILIVALGFLTGVSRWAVVRITPQD